jgi:hypothetical protein
LGKDSIFEIKWKTGDHTWMPYSQITHLNALNQYFEVLGIEKFLSSLQEQGNHLRTLRHMWVG